MRHALLTSALTALLLAGTGACAWAQTSTPSTPPPAAAKPMPPMPPRAGDGEHAGHGLHHRWGMMEGHDFGPAAGTLADLHALERLYIQAGRSRDLQALYNEVLSKSQDPHVREYVYHHLARLQAQPANVDAAIATLRKSLEENLANEAKLRAEREQMRQAWIDRRAGKASEAAP